MRLKWAFPVGLVLLLATTSLPAAGCIPGMPEQAFEPQVVSSGSVFPDLTPVALTTLEEMFPYAASFGDRLYVVYQREDFCGTVKFFGTLQSFDGSGKWSDPLYLSSHDITTPVRADLNLNPRLGTSPDELFVVWTSNDPNWTSGNDDDVVFRSSRDGVNWSEVIEVTGHYNTGLDKLPHATYLHGRTWFVWETNDPLDSDGTDMDVVMRAWDGGDLGQVIEVTSPGDVYNDNFVTAVSDESMMYLTWMRANYSSGKANVYDVWGRVFDGSSWVTPPMKLSSEAIASNEHPTVAAGAGGAFFVWQTSDTPRHSDPSAVVVRRWTPDKGLGKVTFVSSLSSNGEDAMPAALWWDGRLFVSWITNDQGVSFGSDADLVYREGSLGPDGELYFSDIVEVSDPRDDYSDLYPTLVVHDGVVSTVWVVDTNYTHLFTEEQLEPLGGIIRSRDVVIQSIDVPFEKSLSLMYSLGTSTPTAGKPTSASVDVTDLRGNSIDDLRVGFRFHRIRQDPSEARLKLLDDVGGGRYSTQELEFYRSGTYRLAIVVNDMEVNSFVVDVAAPPPSFTARVPVTSMMFAVVGVAMGGLLYRSMGRDELVRELRPAPLVPVPMRAWTENR